MKEELKVQSSVASEQQLMFKHQQGSENPNNVSYLRGAASVKVISTREGNRLSADDITAGSQHVLVS